LSGRGLCDELITRPEESYRLWCVVVCDLETSRIGAPYIYDISRLRVNIYLQYIRNHFVPHIQQWIPIGQNSNLMSFKGELAVVCFLLGNSPVSEFYMPTFRNTLFHLHRQVDE